MLFASNYSNTTTLDHRYHVTWITEPSPVAHIVKINLVDGALGGHVELSNDAVFANPAKGADLGDGEMAVLKQIFDDYRYANEQVLRVSKVAGYAMRWVYANYVFGDAVRQLGSNRMTVTDWAHRVRDGGVPGGKTTHVPPAFRS